MSQRPGDPSEQALEIAGLDSAGDALSVRIAPAKEGAPAAGTVTSRPLTPVPSFQTTNASSWSWPAANGRGSPPTSGSTSSATVSAIVVAADTAPVAASTVFPTMSCVPAAGACSHTQGKWSVSVHHAAGGVVAGCGRAVQGG